MPYMNVVDSVSKRAHFIPTNTTITALGAARLYLNNVWKLHGLPNQVVSDRGPQFVAEFTRELYRMLGIKLAATTAYHPQADGQTERVNQELEQYLRLFVNQRQDDWDELLPMFRCIKVPGIHRIWFSGNRSDNDRVYSTSFICFFADFGLMLEG